MNRLDFIKNIFMASGAVVLPNIELKEYSKIYLLQSFVRGFQYYKGKELISQMKENEILELVREPKNKYDDCAIALHYKGNKIGFIPAESNETLSKLLDANLLELHCEIIAINQNTQSWENIFIAIYALKAIKSNELKPELESLTIQETPQYHTAYTKDKVYRFSKEELNEEEDWKWSGMDRDTSIEEESVINEEEQKIELIKELNESLLNKYGINAEIDYESNPITDSEELIENTIDEIEGIVGQNGKIVESVRKVNTQITISNNLLSKMIKANRV
jgi:hypothetical protein